MAVQRNVPTPTADSTTETLPSRTGPGLESYVLPIGAGYTWSGDEGSFFHACNATVGTGIAGHAAPVVADTDTKALLHVYNGGTKTIIPVYLNLEFTAIGAGGTLSYNVVYIDDKNATARSSGGTAITPVCTNSEGSNTTGATIHFGAVVTAMTSSRKVFSQACREVIPVVEDQITVFFGSPNGGMLSGLTTAGTATANIVQYAPPIAIRPGGNFNFARIRASQSGADSYSFSFGYIER
ncbi:hypothetical protein [Longimicrobium sp.]|uniref:hypothetical protein n=1 Tax=Longimicrobium sp. TaxID=2029185 RepID=UPI002E30DB54|nr:hypothetical protein [Longimicrobium sp.]HEX6038912.1 hypothetical protein [Longimicrobium sp.]